MNAVLLSVFTIRNNLLHHLYIHLLTSVYTVNIYNDSYPITKTFSREAVCHTHCQDLYPWESYIPDMGILSPPKLSVRYLHCRDIFQWEASSFLWQTYSYTVGIYSRMESFLWHTYTNRHIPMGSCKYTLKNLLKYFNCTDISQLDSLCDILILSTYSNGKLSLKYLHCKDILPMEAFSDLPTMWVHFSHGKPFIYVAIRQRKNLFPMGSFLWQKLHCWGTFLYRKLFVTHLHVHMYTEETYYNSHMRLSVTYLHCREIFP